jgi:sulfane dehydrogenase subunit SoxC
MVPPRPRPILDPSGPFSRIPLRPHQLTQHVTPTRDLFVLAHLGVPRVDPATWTLEFDGLVRHPRVYTLDELKRFPKRLIQSFHQCVGNPLQPRVPTRRVADVVWGGVDLTTLLDQVGVEAPANYVWSYGLDHGVFDGTPNESYLKDLPLERVADGDVLVAYELNGEPLPAEHGFPVRLFIPGWYGTNSVKWLFRMTLADQRANGLFTTRLYNDAVSTSDADSPHMRPAWAVAPESLIVAPAPDARLEVGTPVEIWGRAWAARGVRTVDVSVDGGQRWRSAAVEPREEWSWQRFSVPWLPTECGNATLASRATDSKGETQPPTGARNEIYTVSVTVTA